MIVNVNVTKYMPQKSRIWQNYGYKVCFFKLSLSLLQAGLNPSGEGSATRVLRLHSALFSTSISSSRKSTLIHLFLCLPLLRCPRKILLTQSSSSRRCTCPNHLNLASSTLSVMHATPRMRRMSSFLFQALNTQKLVFGRGSAPDPAAEAYDAPQTP